MKNKIAIGIIAFLVLLTGNYTWHIIENQNNIPDTVSITRKPVNQPIPPFVDKTVSDPVMVKKLYEDILSLPYASDGSIACPADFGINYHLTFSKDKKVVVEADVDASGCQMVMLSNSIRAKWTMKPEGRVFWSDLGKTFGLTDKELHPIPKPIQQ